MGILIKDPRRYLNEKSSQLKSLTLLPLQVASFLCGFFPMTFFIPPGSRHDCTVSLVQLMSHLLRVTKPVTKFNHPTLLRNQPSENVFGSDQVYKLLSKVSRWDAIALLLG